MTTLQFTRPADMTLATHPTAACQRGQTVRQALEELDYLNIKTRSIPPPFHTAKYVGIT